LAARLVSVSYRTLKEQIERGQLATTPTGQVSRDALEKFLHQRNSTAHAPDIP
jgi:hypothetical protein